MSAHKVASLAADALAAAHFMVCMALALLGEFTSLFDFMKSKHGGIDFVMRYVDFPIFALLGPHYSESKDIWNLYLFTTMVIVLSSLLYALLCYLATRLLITVFE